MKRLFLLFIIPFLSFGQGVGVFAGYVNSSGGPDFQIDEIEFNPGFQIGLFGDLELSNSISLMPKLGLCNYSFKSDFLFIETSSTFKTIQADINLNIDLASYFFLTVGSGINYSLQWKYSYEFLGIESSNSFNQNDILEVHNNDVLLDPFANIGIGFKVSQSIMFELNYRFLLKYWGTVNTETLEWIETPEDYQGKVYHLNATIGFYL